MTEWIRERAEGIRRAETDRKTERERQVVAAGELKARTEPFWNELVGVLEQAVKDFNVEFPETERRIDQWEKPSPAALNIRRTAYPAAAVKLTLNIAGTSIQYTISKIPRKGSNAVEQQAALGIGIANGEVGYVEAAVHTHEDAAKLLLDPFFGF